MSKVVLDASAMLALLFQEPGGQLLTPELLEDAVIGTVNLAEVQTRLVRGGDKTDKVWADAVAIVSEIHPFTAEQARICRQPGFPNAVAGPLVGRSRLPRLGHHPRCAGLYRRSDMEGH